jgi:hypothetical protein
MDRLHQVITVVTLFLVWSPSVAFAADYCSLIVRVLSPDGRRPQALVSVREKSGRLIQRDPTSKDVKFCDLGIQPVIVKVGADGTCNQVTVADVPLIWQEQYVLKVIYDIEPCLEDPPPASVPICRMVFRVSDGSGVPVANASIQFQGQFSPLKTDSAGRALRVTKVGDGITGSVTAGGYTAKTFSLSCSRSEPVHEELIKLEKPHSR